MKHLILNIALFLSAFLLQAQTVENIRVEQEGEKLKITYRIGASTENQLFDVVLNCSMNGGGRFEPSAVIGDVGANIVGGKSVYTIIWDVFEDVDEVVNPEFFVRVEQTNAAPAAAVTTRSQDQAAGQQDNRQEEQVNQAMKEDASEKKEEAGPGVEPEKERSGPDFSRNGFFAYNGTRWYPIGISFGSLNNWGYYVTPIRMGFSGVYEVYDYYGDLSSVIDFDYMLAAGVTKYIVSAGFYRLHVYGGLGLHADFDRIGIEDYYSGSHVMFDTGVINAIGGFNLTLGFSYSFGHAYPFDLVFGLGFVF